MSQVLLIGARGTERVERARSRRGGGRVQENYTSRNQSARFNVPCSTAYLRPRGYRQTCKPKREDACVHWGTDLYRTPRLSGLRRADRAVLRSNVTFHSRAVIGILAGLRKAAVSEMRTDSIQQDRVYLRPDGRCALIFRLGAIVSRRE